MSATTTTRTAVAEAVVDIDRLYVGFQVAPADIRRFYERQSKEVRKQEKYGMLRQELSEAIRSAQTSDELMRKVGSVQKVAFTSEDDRRRNIHGPPSRTI